MNTLFIKLLVKLQELVNREEGQDLVEYALLITLISLAVITASTNLGTRIATIFNNISTSLA